jgi:hypothetical protein
VLDELSRRKPNFDERNSAPITFVDNQVFYVPKPWLDVRPSFAAGMATTCYTCYTNGPLIDGLLDLAADADDPFERVAAAASIAAIMLQHHYELDDAELDRLLAFRIGDEASADWGTQVISVATGRSGPKVGRGIGDSR